MNLAGPIIVIEDDEDDCELLSDVFTRLPYENELFFFPDGLKALEFLDQSDVIPFLILSDINLPKLDGFALRDKIKMDAELQQRCIPYVFFSTALNKASVTRAYNLSVQGFFKKENSMRELEKTMTVIMEYWKLCASPNKFLEA